MTPKPKPPAQGMQRDGLDPKTADRKKPGRLGIVETQLFHFAAPPNPLRLESGKTLGPITLAYETYGQLNKDRANAVLVLHAFSGDAHAAGYHEGDEDPGWWDTMIGPGKAFDTDKYFVLCINVIGGCKGSTGPSSENPETGKPYGLQFPFITIADMVEAQRRLIDHLGIEKLLCVSGDRWAACRRFNGWRLTPSACGAPSRLPPRSSIPRSKSPLMRWAGKP
jgi:hypothetical protein